MSTEDEKISSLYQQGNKPQPPAHLDDAILNAAKEAVSSTQDTDSINSTKSKTVKGPFSGGWPATVSIAAVLIISIILIPLINEETPTQSTSSDLDIENRSLLEEDTVDRELVEQLDSMKATQRASNVQKKEKEEARQLIQSPSLSSGKAQVFQDALNPATLESNAIKEKSLPMRKLRSIEEESRPEKNNRYNYLLSSPQEDESSAATDSINSQNIPASISALSPRYWLEKIQLLINQNDIKAAKKELDAFKVEYPDEKIEQSILDSIYTPLSKE